jgi:uncharacterized repeat protein (TIGR01451 family)
MYCNAFAAPPTQISLPNITIEKPSNVTIPIGTNGTYTITVKNTGGAPAPDTGVTELLPPVAASSVVAVLYYSLRH